MLTSSQQKKVDEAERARQAGIASAPKLSAATVEEYLNWLVHHLHLLSSENIAHRLAAAELVVRMHMGNAQNKATQHTLVEDGVIKPPPQAS
ncbi:hypothetical protein SAMN05421770_10557 [Granulicella rosea]|uniref:Uncharacterized protein n=1 Tax=Granulicella rosea TaxID=474952 RepID=A0A239KMZ3_9BACT|nr:hypothetical protein [Granulicella rosea]SNT19048.1 hypothetical protein SAMN05421770_10550 [Granulicella rosea]SNT19139.1 hypothetical protein SAMN05421770_10557 [Granulicella rosea]